MADHAAPAALRAAVPAADRYPPPASRPRRHTTGLSIVYVSWRLSKVVGAVAILRHRYPERNYWRTAFSCWTRMKGLTTAAHNDASAASHSCACWSETLASCPAAI